MIVHEETCGFFHKRLSKFETKIEIFSQMLNEVVQCVHCVQPTLIKIQ
jgi:hypothetical protein